LALVPPVSVDRCPLWSAMSDVESCKRLWHTW